MFKNTSKGLATRETILDTALGQFRDRGFDHTTMRDIAAGAELSLGAAYHYFESKEAIVMAYYDRIQAEHARVVERDLDRTASVRRRLGLVIHSKLDLVAKDARLLGALLRFAGDPNHPLSFFGPATRRLRVESVALFASALRGERLPRDLESLTPLSFWALQMGLLLYAVYDRSPGLAKTHRLADGALDLATSLLKVVRLAPLAPIRRRLAGLIDEAGFLDHRHLAAKEV